VSRPLSSRLPGPRRDAWLTGRRAVPAPRRLPSGWHPRAPRRCTGPGRTAGSVRHLGSDRRTGSPRGWVSQTCTRTGRCGTCHGSLARPTRLGVLGGWSS